MENIPHVVPYRGKWAIKIDGKGRALATYDLKADAIDAVRSQSKEYRIHGVHGEIFESVQLPAWINEDEIRAIIRAKMARRAKSAVKNKRTGNPGAAPATKAPRAAKTIK